MLSQRKIFPLKLEGEWRWLEKAKIEQQYIYIMDYDYGWAFPNGRWVDMRFID